MDRLLGLQKGQRKVCARGQGAVQNADIEKFVVYGHLKERRHAKDASPGERLAKYSCA